jgi:hypothetical protein
MSRHVRSREHHMSEPASIPDQLTTQKINVYELLKRSTVIRSSADGRMRWLLDAEDRCELVERAADLRCGTAGSSPSQRRRSTGCRQRRVTATATSAKARVRPRAVGVKVAMSSHAGDGSSATVPRNVWEANLLRLLDQVGVKYYGMLSGEVRWALNADEMCSLVELAGLLHVRGVAAAKPAGGLEPHRAAAGHSGAPRSR